MQMAQDVSSKVSRYKKLLTSSKISQDPKSGSTLFHRSPEPLDLSSDGSYPYPYQPNTGAKLDQPPSLSTLGHEKYLVEPSSGSEIEARARAGEDGPGSPKRGRAVHDHDPYRDESRARDGSDTQEEVVHSRARLKGGETAIEIRIPSTHHEPGSKPQPSPPSSSEDDDGSSIMNEDRSLRYD